MSCLDASEVITWLEALRDMFASLDVPTEVTGTDTAANTKTQDDLHPLLRLIGQNEY